MELEFSFRTRENINAQNRFTIVRHNITSWGIDDKHGFAELGIAFWDLERRRCLERH